MKILRQIFAVGALISAALSLIPLQPVGGLAGQNYGGQAPLDLAAAVNALRESQNLQPYRIDPILMSIAESQANFMAYSRVATHFDANGARPFERAISAGYPVAGDLSGGGQFLENIYVGPKLSAQEVIAKWKADSLSLDLLISASLKDIGVGVASADSRTYYVLDAGAAREDSTATPTPEAEIVPTQTQGTLLAPIAISTALSNGDVYHQVQPREALWSIALAYGTSVEQIKLLNALATDQIFTGQILLIRKSALPTITATTLITATFGIPTSTATKPVTMTSTSTPTAPAIAPATFESGRNAVGFIILIALIAAGLGSWLGRKKAS